MAELWGTGPDALTWRLLMGTALLTGLFAAIVPARIEAGLKARGASPRWAQARSILERRLRGGLLLGVGSVLGSLWLGDALGDAGLGLARPGLAVVMAVGLWLLLVPVLALSSRGEAIRAKYPEIRDPAYTPKLIALSAGSWAVYLLGYELLFRGFLLLPLVEPLGPWAALSLSTALYVLAHVHKPPGELVGCIPMGFLFGAMALLAGGFWPAWLAHLLIAVSSENLIARGDPRISWGAGSGESASPE